MSGVIAIDYVNLQNISLTIQNNDIRDEAVLRVI